MESQAQECRDKMKDLQKELEHMRTQLEFKVRDVFLSYKVTVNIKQLVSEYLISTCKVQLAETFIYAVLIIVTPC
jgi:hypothetical protein